MWRVQCMERDHCQLIDTLSQRINLLQAKQIKTRMTLSRACTPAKAPQSSLSSAPEPSCSFGYRCKTIEDTYKLLIPYWIHLHITGSDPIVTIFDPNFLLWIICCQIGENVKFPGSASSSRSAPNSKAFLAQVAIQSFLCNRTNTQTKKWTGVKT